MRTRLLTYMQKSKMNSFLVGSLTIFTMGIALGYGITYIIKPLYYEIAPSSIFFKVNSAQASSYVEQSATLDVNLCKTIRNPIVSDLNVRSFYKYDGNIEINKGPYQLPVSEIYRTVDNGCSLIQISPKDRPNDLGTYRFCQHIDFKVHGVEKEVNFCSSKYDVIPNQ